MASDKNEMVREAIGIFHSADHMKEAIDDLCSSGFKMEELGLLASENVVKESLGSFYTRTNKGPDSSKAPEIAFIDRDSIGEGPSAFGGGLFFIIGVIIVAAVVISAGVFGGAMVAAIAGLVGVGLVGALVISVIHQSDAQYLRQQIDEGRILLFVRIDTEREQQAMKILKQHCGQDVKMYKIPVNSRMKPNAPEDVKSASVPR